MRVYWYSSRDNEDMALSAMYKIHVVEGTRRPQNFNYSSPCPSFSEHLLTALPFITRLVSTEQHSSDGILYKKTKSNNLLVTHASFIFKKKNLQKPS